MKKLLILLLVLMCCGCSAKREEYYVLHFDDYSLTPGYDNAEFVKLVYDFEIPERLEAGQSYETSLYSFGKHLGEATFTNYKRKDIDSNKAILSKISLFFDENPYYSYRIDDYYLSEYVSENNEHFNGEYIERNGTASVFGKMVGKKKNVVLIQGDIYGSNQDYIYRITVSIEDDK